MNIKEHINALRIQFVNKNLKEPSGIILSPKTAAELLKPMSNYQNFDFEKGLSDTELIEKYGDAKIDLVGQLKKMIKTPSNSSILKQQKAK